MIPSYKKIQSQGKQQYSYTPETSWIAHEKELLGFSVSATPCRKGKVRIKPCSEGKVEKSRRYVITFENSIYNQVIRRGDLAGWKKTT